MNVRKSMVTGGAGFVGRHLVEALVARGDEVTVLDMAAEPGLPDAVRYIRGSITDADQVAEAARGAEVVFHNASVVHTKNNRRDSVFEVNLGGSRKVLAACRDAGVPRLVYVSSASVVYEGRDIEAGAESLPYARTSQAPYADSKIEAEREILAASGRDGLVTCALRPHVIFGPGDMRFLPNVLSRARAGKLRYAVGRSRKLSDFTYVTNLVDALVAADERLADEATRDTVAGRPYFITNGEPRPFFDFVGQLLAALDLPPIRGSIPYWVAYSAAAVAEGLDTLRGGELTPEDGLSRFAIRYMCTHHYFSIERARRELGYEPAVNLDEGIRLTVQDLRTRGAA